MAEGAELAIAEVSDSRALLGGLQVVSVRGDSTCIDSAVAVAAAERLVTADRVNAIVGGDCSGVTIATLQQVANTLCCALWGRKAGYRRIPTLGPYQQYVDPRAPGSKARLILQPIFPQPTLITVYEIYRFRRYSRKFYPLPRRDRSLRHGAPVYRSFLRNKANAKLGGGAGISWRPCR